MSKMTAEVATALETTGQTQNDACVWITRSRRIVEAVKDATPGWQVWKTTPYLVAITVLKGIEQVLCGDG